MATYIHSFVKWFPAYPSQCPPRVLKHGYKCKCGRISRWDEPLVSLRFRVIRVWPESSSKLNGLDAVGVVFDEAKDLP